MPESSIQFIEYLARNEPAAARLLSADAGPGAAHARLLDRLIDDYIHRPLQHVVAERLRPTGQRDPFGVDKAKGLIRAGYDLVAPMIAGPWAMGDEFTLADCAAVPALFYAEHAVPLAELASTRAYLARLEPGPAWRASWMRPSRSSSTFRSRTADARGRRPPTSTSPSAPCPIPHGAA